VSRDVAERTYGVVLSADGRTVDSASTEARRQEIRNARRQQGEPISKAANGTTSSEQNGWRRLLKFHAALELVTDGKLKVIRCVRCGHHFCKADDNYKLYALHHATHLSEIMPPLPSGEPYIGEYHIYTCPGCATQLQVDMFSPSLGGDAVLWDTRIDAERLKLTEKKVLARGDGK